MPGGRSSDDGSDDSSDELFEFGVGYDTSIGRQFEEFIKQRKQQNAKRGTHFGRTRQKLFQHNAANEDEESNVFDKIVIKRKNPSRSIRNPPSPEAMPAQAKAVPSTSFAVPEPRLPLVKKFMNSGQAVARKLQYQLVQKSVPNGARVDVGGLGMAVSTPKSNHTLIKPFNRSVSVSPIRRSGANVQLTPIHRTSQQPTNAVSAIRVISPHKLQPPRDHQLSLTDEEENPDLVDDNEVAPSSSHSSVEIDLVDQSMSIHNPPPAKARGSRSLQRMSLRKESPQKNVTQNTSGQHGVAQNPAKTSSRIISLIDDWSDDGAAANQQHEPVQPRKVSFHRTVTVIPTEESSTEESSSDEPEEAIRPPQRHSSIIRRRRSIHEDDDCSENEYRPVLKKRSVAAKAPAQNPSSQYDTVEYETPDSDGNETASKSKEPPRNLNVIEEEIHHIYEELAPNQAPEPKPVEAPAPHAQSNSSSNDSVYYDTQKSPRSEVENRTAAAPPPQPHPFPPLESPNKRSTRARRSWFQPPESPLESDGSLLMSNECEDVRKSIMSQDNGRDKDGDVFVVPSQSMVVKKKKKPKKTKTVKRIPVIEIPRIKHFQPETSSNSSIKRKLFTHTSNTSFSGENKSPLSESSQPLDMRRSHRRTQPNVGNSSRESLREINAKSPAKVNDEPSTSASVEALPIPKPKNGEIRKRKKKRIEIDEPQPSTSKAKDVSRNSGTVEAPPVKGGKKRTKKSKKNHVEPQPSTSKEEHVRESPVEDDSAVILRRTKRRPVPRKGLVPLEVYLESLKTFAAQNRAKRLERENRLHNSNLNNVQPTLRPRKITLVEQPRLEIIPESPPDAARTPPPDAARTPPPAAARTRPAVITDKLSQGTQTVNSISTTVAETTDWLKKLTSQDTLSDLPQQLPLLFGDNFSIYGDDNIQFFEKAGYDFSQIASDGSGSAGYIRLHPLAMKPLSRSRESHTKMFLLCGKVTLLLDDREISFVTGNFLTVERGHKYAMQNTLDSEALIFYIKILPMGPQEKCVT